MDTPRLIRLPAIAFDKELADVAAAIELVAAGAARRVTLTSVRRSEEIAPEALALAQAAGVRFALKREHRNVPPAIVIGPVEE